MEIVSHLPVRTSKEMSVFCLLCPLSSYKCYPGSDGILPRWLPAAWCWWCWLSQSAVRAFTTIKWHWLGVATLRVNYHHFTDWSPWIRDYNMIGNQRAEHSQARLSHHWPASQLCCHCRALRTTNHQPKTGFSLGWVWTILCGWQLWSDPPSQSQHKSQHKSMHSAHVLFQK